VGSLETKISKIKDNDVIIRGYSLRKLSRESSYPESLFILLTGRKPSEEELKIFDKILILCIDHGAAPASSQAARLIASVGNKLHHAIAAGVLALGDYHGGACEETAQMLLSGKNAREILEEYKQRKRRVL